MELLRCDECCNVLDGIDDGIVYYVDEKAREILGKYTFHICKDCLDGLDELGELIITGNWVSVKK